MKVAIPRSGQPLYSQLLTMTTADLEEPGDGTGLYTWNVSDAGAFFNTGDMFTFSFSVQQPGIEIAGNQEPGYDGGELFIDGNPLPSNNPIRDMAFISYACIESGPKCNAQQSFKLLPDDGAPGDLFGIASISGNVAIVGCSRDDDNGEDSGSAYIFDVATGNEVWKLLPDDGAADDRFGSGVSVSGNIAIVGAIWDDDNGEYSGSAYLFDVTTGQQVTKLLPIDGVSNDSFGRRVAINGTTAIISADEACYLFDVSTGQQLAKLLPNVGEDSAFGVSVAIGDKIAIVGASSDETNGFGNGAAYLFDTVTGQQLFKLLPPTTNGIVDHFGWSVAISGNIAIVGAPQYDIYGISSGAAFLFDVSTGEQINQLLPIDGAAGDVFGYSVAINSNVAIVAAPQDDDDGNSSGSAYLFDVATGLQIAKLTASDGAEGDSFGRRPISLDGNTAIIGAYLDDDNGEDSGSAYLFDISCVVSPVCAGSGALIEGAGESGDFNVTCGSDDSYWAAHGATFAFAITDPVVQFELTSTAPAGFGGSTISVDVEASKQNANGNLNLRALLFNFATGNYVSLPGIMPLGNH